MNTKKYLFVFYITFCMFFIAPSGFCVEIVPDKMQDNGVKQFVFSLDDTGEAVETLEGSIEISEQKPFLSDYIELKDEEPAEEMYGDDILLNSDFSPAYRVNQIKKVSTYSKSLDMPKAEDVVFGNDKFNVMSKSTQYNDSDTLNKKHRQEFGATVRHKAFSLSGGVETIYDTTNISQTSRGAFLTPRLQLGERFAVSMKNKISGQKLDKYEPMVGIDYTPKHFKNSSIWMGAGATILNNQLQSQSLRLNTNFYLF